MLSSMEGSGTARLRHEAERLVCAAFANRFSLIHVGTPQMHQVNQEALRVPGEGYGYH